MIRLGIYCIYYLIIFTIFVFSLGSGEFFSDEETLILDIMFLLCIFLSVTQLFLFHKNHILLLISAILFLFLLLIVMAQDFYVWAAWIVRLESPSTSDLLPFAVYVLVLIVAALTVVLAATFSRGQDSSLESFE